MAQVLGSTSIAEYVKKLYVPQPTSHKGQNGRLLIIGGSNLFHAASLWAANTASRLVDMVHYSTTLENQAIFLHAKAAHPNGMVVQKSDLLSYVEEDNCILIGPGMVRGTIQKHDSILNFDEIMMLQNEAQYAYELTKHLLLRYPDKKFVIDAGALQLMELDWLRNRNQQAIVTPHIRELATLLNGKMSINEQASPQEYIHDLRDISHDYGCTILFKHIDDFISNGVETVIVKGGNAGLTKGGTGDALAGLVAALYTHNDPMTSCVIASYLLKTAAESLFASKGFFYNTSELVDHIGYVYQAMIVDFS